MIRRRKMWFTVSGCLVMVVTGANARNILSQEEMLSPGDDIQAAVSAAPTGTTFLLQPGVYRMQSIEPKNNDVFSGQGPSVILNGSQILSFQKAASGNLWVAAGKSTGVPTGINCNSNAPLCDAPQDLFIDGVRQLPVASASKLTDGSWYFDHVNNLVYLSMNPTGHMVELSMIALAFYGAATGVQINHVIVEKYGDDAQRGAIGNRREGTAWVVDSVEVRWNHGAGVELGPGSTLSNSFIHHNGQLGAAMGGLNCTATGNEIAWNNYAGYNPGWEAGGSKFWATTNLVVESNFVHDNAGPGLWTDDNNVNTLYADNTVTNNLSTGIQHEISYNATIRDNIVKGNGNSQTIWLWNAQISLQNSSNSLVYGNTVEVPTNGGNGIAIINQNRGSGTQGPWVGANDSVYDNTVTYLGSNGRSGLVDDTGGNTAVNNSFNSNHYILKAGGAGLTHWDWFQAFDWKGFQSAGQELNGTCCN
jgi:hypothetical protein